MEQIVAFGDRSGRIQKPITRAAFEHWKNKEFTFDGLQGLRYGQSFCNRFGITDNLLYYTQWPTNQLDEYIERYYLENN